MLSSKPHVWGLPLSLLAVLLLVIRIFGVKPAIMQDEMIYAKYSRLLPMSDAPIPDYLFYWIFGATKSCGTNFYTCGKAINIFAFIALAFVIYLITRKVLSAAQSWFVAVAVMFSPIGFYASFYMPEMLFFLSISILALVMLNFRSESKMSAWFALGLGLGIAALTKPHALFFGAVIAIFIVYLEVSAGKPDLKKIALKVSFAALGSIVSKFLLGFLFAGVNGLSLFGSSYSGTISTSNPTNSPESVASDAGTTPSNGTAEFLSVFGLQTWGHLLAASMLFLAPIVTGILVILSKDSSSKDGFRKKIAVISLASIFVGILTISSFTALITLNGSDHSTRIMVRYYDYIVPFMYVLLALTFGYKANSKSGKAGKIVAATFSALGILAMATNLAPFKPAFYDGTSLAANNDFAWVGWVIVAVSILLVFLNFLDSKLTTALTSALLVILTIGLSTVGLKNIDPLREPDRFDYAANFVTGYLNSDELGNLTVIAHEDYALARALMLIDNPGVDYRVISRGETFGTQFLDKGKEWVLLIGNTFIDQPGCLRQQGSGYVLIKLCSSPEFYFNQVLPTDLISSVSGISYPEDWGSWTVGNRAVINFAKPLPANSKIQITMAAPRFTQDQNFVATLGNSSIEFNLTPEAIDGDFEFQNSAPASQLVIEIPNPKSEKSEGISSNTRLVGIMLYKIKVQK